MTVNMHANPFFLNEAQIQWVENTFAKMTVQDKLGQIMCPAMPEFSDENIRHYFQEMKVGGAMIRPMPAAMAQSGLRSVQNACEIPLLVSANLESGGNGAVAEGTQYAMPEGCAATGDLVSGYRLGKISCMEAKSVGVTWGYAPLVDIDMNYGNPITNVRSFGNDARFVEAMAAEYLKASKEEGIAATIKHFPGDGVDERDQHLLVSVNSLSYEEWMQTFGMVYQSLIDKGAVCVMAGHIAQPNVARKMDAGITAREAIMPGTLSKPLLTGMLRNKMGFNGLVVTDSTLMVGFMQHMPRRKAVPYCIECGCDMLLFSRSIDEDYRYMVEGYQNGILSQARLDEAVLRVLALKSYLRLPQKKEDGTLVPEEDPAAVINSPVTKQWVEECADHAVTLVKDNHSLIPLSPEKWKRIYLNVIENTINDESRFAKDIQARLERDGFTVELRRREFDFDPEAMMRGEMTEGMQRIMSEVSATTEDFVGKYDLCMIVVNMETVSNATVVRINWKVMFGMGNDIPWYAGEMPLVVVSTANPYHLLDIPMANVYVNSYTANLQTLDATFDKLMGRSVFKGVSPVNPFCGHEDCEVF